MIRNAMYAKATSRKEIQNMCQNGKPFIYRKKDRKMVGGILDTDQGIFLPVMDVNDERDMDTFLEMFEISAISISDRLFTDKTKQLTQEFSA